MLQRHVISRNHLPQTLQTAAPLNTVLTQKQWKRALEIQKQIKLLEQKLALTLGETGWKP